MKETLLENIEADICYLNDRIVEVTELAKNLIDEYYLHWKQENKKALTLKKLGLSVEVGTIGPRLNSKKGNGKVYVEWQQYKKSMVFEKNNYGKYIKPYKIGYSERQFSLLCTNWEFPLVVECEESLAILRKLLENYHNSKVKLNSSVKSINKL